MTNELKILLENEIIKSMSLITFKPILEDNCDISDAYDNNEITHDDFYKIRNELIEKLQS